MTFSVLIGGRTSINLLAQQTIATTSAVTVTLSEDLTNYDKVMVSMMSYPMDGEARASTSSGTIFMPVSDFMVGSHYINWSGGNNGSGYFYYTTVTYVSPTSITIKPGNKGSRYYFVYGIK